MGKFTSSSLPVVANYIVLDVKTKLNQIQNTDQGTVLDNEINEFAVLSLKSVFLVP